MIKTIGVVILVFGFLILLGSLGWGNPPNGMDGIFFIGLALTIVGVLIFIYNPVEDMKTRLIKHARHTLEDTLPDREGIKNTAGEAEQAVRSAARETTRETRKRINKWAKEVEKMTE